MHRLIIQSIFFKVYSAPFAISFQLPTWDAIGERGWEDLLRFFWLEWLLVFWVYVSFGFPRTLARTCRISRTFCYSPTPSTPRPLGSWGLVRFFLAFCHAAFSIDQHKLLANCKWLLWPRNKKRGNERRGGVGNSCWEGEEKKTWSLQESGWRKRKWKRKARTKRRNGNNARLPLRIFNSPPMPCHTHTTTQTHTPSHSHTPHMECFSGACQIRQREFLNPNALLISIALI